MQFPDLVQSPGEQVTEGRAHADVGGKVAAATHAMARGVAVVSMFLVVEGKLHEPGKGEGAVSLKEGAKDAFE